MTAYPKGQAGSITAAEVNRVAKICAADLANPSPDVLTLLKLQVEIMDQLEVSDNAAWVTRLAQLPAAAQKLFEAGPYNRLRYRHRAYGYDVNTLYSLLFAMMTNNKITRWYNIAASNAVAGELESVTEVLGGTALTQVAAARKPALVSSTNSLPVAQFDGTDVWQQTLDPAGTGNNGTDKWWLFIRFRPADLGGNQTLYAATTLSGASANRVIVMAESASGKVSVDVYATSVAGRRWTATTIGLVALTWASMYVQWDNTQLGPLFDADGNTTNAKFRVFVNGTAIALTQFNVGAGADPGAMMSVTGTAVLGATSDTDAPTGPIRNGGLVGTNTMFGIEPLTTDELANLVAFMVPT